MAVNKSVGEAMKDSGNLILPPHSTSFLPEPVLCILGKYSTTDRATSPVQNLILAVFLAQETKPSSLTLKAEAVSWSRRTWYCGDN